MLAVHIPYSAVLQLKDLKSLNSQGQSTKKFIGKMHINYSSYKKSLQKSKTIINLDFNLIDVNEYDFIGNNSTTWTEYMTGTFYNITRNKKPCLSFGISVKNATKYKNLLNFLNYCKFESYIQDIIEKFDEKYCIETILYANT